ncbi:MAG TPA: tetratricopeptide repeat protein [Bryobacteraceae bacterium]|nr:tetratricopeptide repeat protein [Bryobacteraceae bacterium]
MRLVILAVGGVLAVAAQPRKAFDDNEHGVAAASRGDYKEAERLYSESVALWRELGPKYEAHLAISEANLADALCAQGRREEGAKLENEALATLRRTLGIRNINTLNTMNSLAGIDIMLGETGPAEQFLREALAVERELYPNDVQLTRSLIGLATIRLRGGKYDEGLPLAEEGLRNVQKAGADDTLDAALAYTTVAEIHRCAKRPERALPLYRKARAIYERKLGPGSVRVAVVLTQEGLILLGEGKVALADKAVTRSLDLVENGCPGCAAERFVVETNAALVRLQQGRYSEADRLLSGAISLEEQAHTHPGADVASALNTLALVREKERLYEDADRLHKRAAAILAYQ